MEHPVDEYTIAAILQQTAEYIYNLEQEKTQLLSQNCQLKRLVSQHDSGELPPKKRKTEIILPISDSSDEGLGSMSPEPLNAIAVVNSTDTLTNADLRRQLEHERNLRMMYEEQLRRLESQHILYQQQPQLYQVEETEELNLQLVAPESLPLSPSPTPTPEQRLPSVLEAAIKAEPKVEVERLPSPNNSHEENTPARLYASNTSRQNLETIVEAIRHLEGDHMFGDEPQTQEAPLALTTRTPDHLIKVEMNPFLDFHGSSVQHQQQSRPGVIVVKQAS
ncbi:basic helix-loop-helix zip transcription factor [Holotrichia oblita]|uniref:Basic helix-loop-helix zip transcription factor n=1 Tax=Holotrichia oblita TaxID=644536 RepID=A0ACB9T7W9_HOLOL|nr:basic helix-loop-helix zip transcription factor [Holotrichia oblita]